MLTDEARVTLVLLNVMQQAVKMARQESQIKVDYQVDFEGKRLLGKLHITVKCTSDHVFSEYCERILR